ncbi:MAG: hypothetical protein WD180_07965, partial [Pseudohongiellaceae bacterium]
DTSLAILQENYPTHDSLGNEGDFIIRTEITNPSLLYTATFGLLGDNRVQPPLAPTTRPNTPGNREIIDAQGEPGAEEDRSWLNIITFGILG